MQVHDVSSWINPNKPLYRQLKILERNVIISLRYADIDRNYPPHFEMWHWKLSVLAFPHAVIKQKRRMDHWDRWDCRIILENDDMFFYINMFSLGFREVPALYCYRCFMIPRCALDLCLLAWSLLNPLLGMNSLCRPRQLTESPVLHVCSADVATVGVLSSVFSWPLDSLELVYFFP